MGRASVTRARSRALGTALALAAGCLAAAGVPVASAHVPPRCDNLDPTVCLQPFPNDYFTRTDSRTDTGRRVHFDLLAMPRNAAGKPIDPTEWNRNDGFSPGALITLHIAGLDNQMALDRTGAVPITDLPAYRDHGAPVVVLDAGTHKRWPIWTEIDSQADTDAHRNLIVRPATNFTEGHRYIVALRNLKDAAGNSIPAPAAFRAFRDDPRPPAPSQTYAGGDSGRAAHMESIFRTLAKAGISRSSLYMAWDFTVAGQRNLTGRMLHIRDDAFGQLGDRNLADQQIPSDSKAPRFVVTSVKENVNADIARQIQGRFYVPCYLNTPRCASGGSFFYPPGSDLPSQLPGNEYEAKFLCNVPHAASADSPATTSLYGHGLFGSRSEANQGQLQDMSQEHDFMFCATEEIGMACSVDTPSQDPSVLLAQAQKGVLPDTPECDIPNVVTAIADITRFQTMIDRLQQGILDELYLARLMAHPHGFASDSAFQGADGRPLIKTGRSCYDGNSQGGIMGGAVIALMVDCDHGTIGVPGMNYSTLLQRSTDFGRGGDDEGPPNRLNGIPSYAWLVYHAYPNQADRQVVLGLIQMLWDRGEADGYAENMTNNPLPNTPAHKVLMELAFGDHQVSNWAAAVEARTAGAKLRTPAVDLWRDPLGVGDATFFGDLDPIPGYPYTGSAITVWDSGAINASCHGNGPPPFGNVPPTNGCPAGDDPSTWGGDDPHEYPRRTPAARQMKADFIQNGYITDTCNGAPCHSYNWTGAP